MTFFELPLFSASSHTPVRVIEEMSGAGMLLDGDRTSGMDVRNANVTAAVAIANIVKTSLGPVGLDKMLVDEIGDVTITNDGATILAQLDIEHPAAKVLVELAQLQDQEVGDGTTSVVIVAAELLKKANELVKDGIHPTVVMAGYRIAVKEAVKYIKDHLVVKADELGTDNLISAGTCFVAFGSLLVDSHRLIMF
jgi:T-complex protein 1 subunit alpha